LPSLGDSSDITISLSAVAFKEMVLRLMVPDFAGILPNIGACDEAGESNAVGVVGE
jgi:hypothetical protein